MKGNWCTHLPRQTWRGAARWIKLINWNRECGKRKKPIAISDRIQVFDSEGNFLTKWGGPFAINIPGGFRGWFRTATGVAVGPDENIFVADFYNHRIQKFTPAGEFLVAFGEQGEAPGQYERPTDITVDDEGNVYVVDFGNHRIQKLAPVR